MSTRKTKSATERASGPTAVQRESQLKKISEAIDRELAERRRLHGELRKLEAQEQAETAERKRLKAETEAEERHMMMRGTVNPSQEIDQKIRATQLFQEMLRRRREEEASPKSRAKAVFERLMRPRLDYLAERKEVERAMREFIDSENSARNRPRYDEHARKATARGVTKSA